MKFTHPHKPDGENVIVDPPDNLREWLLRTGWEPDTDPGIDGPAGVPAMSGLAAGLIPTGDQDGEPADRRSTLEELTGDQLKDLAKQEGRTGYSRLGRADLVELLLTPVPQD